MKVANWKHFMLHLYEVNSMLGYLTGSKRPWQTYTFIVLPVEVILATSILGVTSRPIEHSSSNRTELFEMTYFIHAHICQKCELEIM